jgi:glycolate oxidase
MHNRPEADSTAIRRRRFARELMTFLPPEAILNNPEELSAYESDALTVFRQVPLIAVLPETVTQLRQLMLWCRDNRVPVVARGAGTGLSGGALPHKEGILLVLTRFNRILELDPERCCARVEPGVANLAISDAARAHGLYYAPDPSSQIACTIGGNVAENSGGVHCLKYGLTVHNILEIKVITLDGEIITIGSQTLDCPGYDFLSLLTGSEGMLAVTIEITVKLLPVPESAQLVLAAFGSIEDAGNAVTRIIAGGIIPAGLELMDRLAIQAAEAYACCGYPVTAEALLLCELDGIPEEVRDQITTVTELMQRCNATEIRVAQDEAERLLFWKGRKSAFPAVGRIAPDYYCMDGTIPRKRLTEVLGQIRELSGIYGLPVANVFHAGDGNLHPLILFDANRPGELDRTMAMGSRILQICIAAGGTITGEHGVGIEKIKEMCVQFSAAELQQFHELKAAFDPYGLLNPGKAVPTSQRCAEFGAMHVHQGDAPFPELERF